MSGIDADRTAVGCTVDLEDAPEAISLFGEAPSRVLLSLSESSLPAFSRVAGRTPWRVIGLVGGNSLTLRYGNRDRVKVPIAALAAARERAFAGVLV